MDRFTVEVIAQTPQPQQVIYAAMHQDYAEEFVWSDRDRFPSEEKCGELVVKHLLAGNRGHYGPLEHPQIVLNCGWFPHSTMQQIRTHRVGISFDVQCLAGDTEITFVKASGALRKIRIAELYDLWTHGEKAVRERKIQGRKGEPPGQYRRDCQTRLKNMRLRVLNEETELFETSRIRDVMCSGLQPVYRLTLEDGRTLDCTTNHRLLTTQGWQTMGEAVGLQTADDGSVVTMTRHCAVMANGMVAAGRGLYRDKIWLGQQIHLGLSTQEIASLADCSETSVRYWAKRLGLQLNRSNTQFHKGQKPWNYRSDALYLDKQWLETQLNQGLSVDQMAEAAECSIEAIKKWVYYYDLTLNKRPTPFQPGFTPWNKGKAGYHLNLSASSYEKRRENAARYTKRGPESNFWKGGTSLRPHPLAVIKIEYLGWQMTYDLEVEDPWHNFVANGLVVHNSFRYTGSRILDVVSGKRDVEEVFYLRPMGAYSDRQGKHYDYTEALRQQDLEWCLQACHRYKERIDQGFAEEHARGLIPFDVRQHWVMSANVRSLMHLLDLRWKSDAQLEAQKLCETIWPHFQSWVPEIANWYETNRLKKARLAP